jgi:hypothetical protein
LNFFIFFIFLVMRGRKAHFIFIFKIELVEFLTVIGNR